MKRKRGGGRSTYSSGLSSHPLSNGKDHGVTDEGEPSPIVEDQECRQPETPNKLNGLNGGTADRSARRKSARLLFDQPTNEDGSEDGSGDELLAQEILDGEEDEEDEEQEGVQHIEAMQEDGLLANTPSKKANKVRARAKKERTPSPPPNLPAYEQYFFQNRPGGSKTSDNTVATSTLISHEDYFTTISAWKDPHEPELDFLHALHSRSFDQYVFELEQGFNLCLFGWGSKREIMLDFAQHLEWERAGSKIIVLNGYNQELTLRDIFTTIASTIPQLAASGSRLGSQPSDMLANILNAVANDPPEVPVTLLIHSIDGVALRRSATQSLLARLALSPHVQILASADTPNFPLMWDASLMTDFNWLFHDCTSFQPYDIEISGGGAGGVVDEVNALLGRSGRKMHGREGVMYVLKSLTQSARGLFGLLVAELLSLDEDGGMEASAMDADEDEDDFEAALMPAKAKGKALQSSSSGPSSGVRAAIEWRTLYQKAVSQFIATNEMSFRGLLKEFHDHEMIVSRRDALGTEMLSVPFRRDELETLLEELTGELG